MVKIDLKNIFGKKTEEITFGYSPAWPVNYIRDWKILVLIFAIGLAGLSIFAWRIYLSDKIAGGYLASEIKESDISVVTLDVNKLKADLNTLQLKQTNFIKVKVDPVKLVDPSL